MILSSITHAPKAAAEDAASAGCASAGDAVHSPSNRDRKRKRGSIKMGREVFHGDPKGEATEIQAYNESVREGAFGLLLNSVVLGIASFLIEPMCQRFGSRLVWASSNFIVFVCMTGTAVISLISVRQYSDGVQHVIGANGTTKIASLVVFALLGLPLAITYSVPFSVTADSGGGQGLAIGVLNLAIVIPQVVRVMLLYCYPYLIVRDNHKTTLEV